MFTGIIEEVGEVLRAERRGDIHLFTIAARKTLEDMELGDSISVAGVCLTVVGFAGAEFTVEATPETMSATNLNELKPGYRVNLERALRLGGKMGGHLVTGHIDGTGRIAEINRRGESYVVSFQAPEQIIRYVVPKGSVAVDGISLTVARVWNDGFNAAIIPFTYGETTISRKAEGALVNIECDIIGKYVERLLTGYGVRGDKDFLRGSGGINAEFLARHGFV